MTYVRIHITGISIPEKGAIRIRVRDNWYEVRVCFLHRAEADEIRKLRKSSVLDLRDRSARFLAYGSTISVASKWKKLQELPYKEVKFK